MSTNGTQNQFEFSIPFFQMSYMNLTSIISLIILTRLQFKFYKRKLKLSTQLRIHMICWTFCLICTLIYIVPYLIFLCFFPGTQKYNHFWSAIRGSINFGAINTTEISTLFLALDRIFALLFPLNSNFRHYIHMLSRIVIATIFSSILSVAIVRLHIFDVLGSDATTECLSFNCFSYGKIQDILVYRIVISWTNFTLGLVFVCIYYKYGRMLTIRKEKKKNLFVLNIFICELCFTIIPTTFYAVFEHETGTIITTIINSIISFGYCTDGFANSIIYWRTWNEKATQKTRNIVPARRGLFQNTSNLQT